MKKKHRFCKVDSLVGLLCAVLCTTTAFQGPANARSPQRPTVRPPAVAPYVFSTTTCQTRLLPSTRNSDGAEFEIDFPMTEKSGPADLLNTSVSALSWVYEISGACTAHVKSASLDLVLLDNGQVLRAHNNVIDVNELPVEAEVLSSDNVLYYQSTTQPGIVQFFKLGWPAAVWLYKDTGGTYSTTIRIRTSPELRLITSQLPLRSVIYSPGIHGDGGQITVLQEQRDGKLRVITLDIRHP
jgi:hypothetical protein